MVNCIVTYQHVTDTLPTRYHTRYWAFVYVLNRNTHVTTRYCKIIKKSNSISFYNFAVTCGNVCISIQFMHKYPVTCMVTCMVTCSNVLVQFTIYY